MKRDHSTSNYKRLSFNDHYILFSIHLYLHTWILWVWALRLPDLSHSNIDCQCHQLCSHLLSDHSYWELSLISSCSLGGNSNKEILNNSSYDCICINTQFWTSAPCNTRQCSHHIHISNWLVEIIPSWIHWFTRNALFPHRAENKKLFALLWVY